MATLGIAVPLSRGAEAQTGRPPPEDAATILRQADAAEANNEPRRALAMLERFLAPRGTDQSDLELVALIRLRAAQIAAAQGPDMADRVREHLAAGEHIATSTAFAHAPRVAAYLERDFAAVHLALGTPGELNAADRLLSHALTALEASDVLAAIGVAHMRGSVRLDLVDLRNAVADFRRSLELIDKARASGLKPDASTVVAVATNLATALAELDEEQLVFEAAERARREAGTDRRLQAAADALLAWIGSNPDLEGDPLRGHAWLLLATTRFDRGLTREAAEAATNAMAAYEAPPAKPTAALARARHVLATALAELGDLDGAAAKLDDAASVWKKLLGPDSQSYLETQVERGWVDIAQGYPDGAKARAIAAIEGYRRAPPPDQRPLGLAHVLMGLVAEENGRNGEAVELYRSGQELITAARGPMSPDLGFSLVRLGRLLTRTGPAPEAEAPLDHAVAIYAILGSASTVRLADALAARAAWHKSINDCRGAIDDARQALAHLRESVGAARAHADLGGDFQRISLHGLFVDQARLLIECAPVDEVASAFAASQDAITSSAGDAIQRMAAAFASRDVTFGRLLRARAEMVEMLRRANSRLVANVMSVSPNATEQATALRVDRDGAASRLHELESEIASGFPQHSRLLSPTPASIAEIEASLETDEAVLAPVLSDQGTLLWVVTRGATRALLLAAANAEVTAWVRDVQAGVDLDSVNGRPGRLPQFNVPAARRVYDLLIGAAEGTGLLDAVRHLIVVLDGPLQSLPPHLLVSPKERWAVERYAISVAPSLAAVAASQAMLAHPSRALKPFIGIAEPVRPVSGGGGVRPEVADLARRLESLQPLAAMAQEVRSLVSLHRISPDGALLVGDAATVTNVTGGHLGQFRTIAFATHAVMAGDYRNLGEPALVLTPEIGENRLGLLTASTISGLTLDADLVMLSACNTAAGNGSPTGEVLSGLAQAFLNAGARSVLVSAWSVLDAASAKLTTNFIQARLSHPARGAAALREAMLALMIDPDPLMHHPVAWAPFMLVGR